MTVGELIELLKKAPQDDIIMADIGQDEIAGVSDMLTASDVLVGNGTIRGITYLKIDNSGKTGERNIEMADAKKIRIEYEDGSAKELSKGIAAEFDNENMSIDMIHISGLDILRIAYGMMALVEEAGMMPLFQAYLSGEPLPDEN